MVSLLGIDVKCAILRLLMSHAGSMRIKDVADALNISYRIAYNAIKNLERLSILRITRSGVMIDDTLKPMIAYLQEKYGLSKILDHKNIKILGVLLRRRTIVEIREEVSTSEKTIRERILDLLNSGIIRKVNDGYEIVDDPILKAFIYITHKRVMAVEPHAEIAYEGRGIIIKRCRREYACKGALTAFSKFGEYGIEIESPWNYFVFPEMEIGIEEVIIHSLLVAKTRYERALIALLYAKNHRRIDVKKLMNLAIKFGVLSIIAKMEQYLMGREFLDLFLPLREFDELAKQHNVDPSVFKAKRFSLEFLRKVGKVLEGKSSALLIGGGAMVHRGYKHATGDIDLIALNEESLNELIKALQKVGYKIIAKNEMITLENIGPRIDLYLKGINGKFVVTESVLARAEKMKMGNLTLYIASDTDLLITKMLTERLRDYEDVKLLIRRGRISWRDLVEELEEQDKIIGYPVSFQALIILEHVEKELKIKIRYKRRLKSIALKSMIKFAYEKLGIRTVKELKKMINYPEETIRKKLKEVIRELEKEKQKSFTN